MPSNATLRRHLILNSPSNRLSCAMELHLCYFCIVQPSHSRYVDETVLDDREYKDRGATTTTTTAILELMASPIEFERTIHALSESCSRAGIKRAKTFVHGVRCRDEELPLVNGWSYAGRAHRDRWPGQITLKQSLGDGSDSSVPFYPSHAVCFDPSHSSYAIGC